MKDKFKLANHNRIGKIIYYSSIGVLALAVAIIILILCWEVTPSNILQIKNNPVPVEKPSIEGGNIQVVDINYCKNENVKGYVTWSLISKRNIILLPPYEDTNIVGCNNIRAPMILPFITYTDKYYFHWAIKYQINPLKTSTVEFSSQEFTIVGKESL